MLLIGYGQLHLLASIVVKAAAAAAAATSIIICELICNSPTCTSGEEPSM